MIHEKPVTVSAHLVPNLLMHSLIALELDSKLIQNVNPAYREDYRTWCTEKEKEKLQEGRFNIEGVSSNAHFAMFYQIPAYFAGDSIDSLNKTLNELASKGLPKFLEIHPSQKKILANYVPLDMIEIIFGSEILDKKNYERILIVYSEIISQIYERDYRNKWLEVKRKLEGTKKSLQFVFQGDFDFIGSWERITGITFPYSNFEVELIDPVSTMGTSLLAERDGFYAHISSEMLVNLISHEIGTHILFNTYSIRKCIKRYVETDLERFLKVNEIISWAINCRLLDKAGLLIDRYENLFMKMHPVAPEIHSMIKEVETINLKESYEKSLERL